MKQGIAHTISAAGSAALRFVALLACMACLLSLGGCNDEDDVNEIFTGKTWKLTYIGSTDDWTDLSTGVNLNDYHEEKRPVRAYTVIFYEGSVRITGGENTVWTGTWWADGENNTFHIDISEKQGEGSTANERTFLQAVAEACYYRGSSVLLRLFDIERSGFVQFSPLGNN